MERPVEGMAALLGHRRAPAPCRALGRLPPLDSEEEEGVPERSGCRSVGVRVAVGGATESSPERRHGLESARNSESTNSLRAQTCMLSLLLLPFLPLLESPRC